MNKVLKYILFRTVLVIITLHAIIPHPHSDELTEDKHFQIHKESNSLIGLIKLTFHESDNEHLDNLILSPFESAKESDNCVKYPTPSILNITPFISDKKENIIKYNTNNFDRLFFVKQNRLRGPPLSA